MCNAFMIEGDNAQLLIVPIPPLEELEATADERDLRSVEGFTAPSRRTERLAWRAVLREVSPEAEVEYLPSGAPSLKNSPYTYISVSHCRDRVAVALSCEVCGVDIERTDRDFSRVAARYMSDAERELSSEVWWPAAVWCAKESLYKMMGRDGVDFLRDIAVVGVNPATRKIFCRVSDMGEVTLEYSMPDEEHIAVYKL